MTVDGTDVEVDSVATTSDIECIVVLPSCKGIGVGDGTLVGIGVGEIIMGLYT